MEVRSLVINLLKRVDKTAKYHPNVVDAAVERAINQAYSDIMLSRPQELDNYTRAYGDNGTTITVSSNSNTNIKYSDLPADYVPLPDLASGVRAIYTATTGGKVFIPMSAQSFDFVTHSTHTSNVTDMIGYVVRRDKVEYFNMDSTTQSAGVRMEILLPFRSYADTDDVLLPFSRDLDFLEAVLRIMGIVPPADLKDDNADEKVNVNTQQTE